MTLLMSPARRGTTPGRPRRSRKASQGKKVAEDTPWSAMLTLLRTWKRKNYRRSHKIDGWAGQRRGRKRVDNEDSCEAGLCHEVLCQDTETSVHMWKKRGLKGPEKLSISSNTTHQPSRSTLTRRSSLLIKFANVETTVTWRRQLRTSKAPPGRSIQPKWCCLGSWRLTASRCHLTSLIQRRQWMLKHFSRLWVTLFCPD